MLNTIDEGDDVEVFTLGTAGGPVWWGAGSEGHTRGISTVVVVGNGFYLVDVGYGTWAALNKAGLSMTDLRGIFITHLHSDHLTDLTALLTFGAMALDRMGVPENAPRIPIFGPGNREVLPPLSAFPPEGIQPRFQQSPTPGTQESVTLLAQSLAVDTNDRVLDELRSAPLDRFIPVDILLPAELNYDANAPVPRISPFPVEAMGLTADDLVNHHSAEARVTATLVTHEPMAPAFAFRFDSGGASVTISGDTGISENLIELAKGTGLLLHEAMDPVWLSERFGPSPSERDKASIAHHQWAHTTPEDAGRVAERAGAGALALHHLVPGNSPESAWRRAEETFSGAVLVPRDGDRIQIEIPCGDDSRAEAVDTGAGSKAAHVVQPEMSEV